MKAKQFIYTSWKNGNSPSKGFMVYSMSEGISADDSAAIQIALKYLPPAGLPYAPTPEQIESMFPRGCAYFRLPSGKYCIGQSTYIGKDYSGRQNNYIIHAFVFDEKPDFNAFDFIDSTLFKRNLTEEEANADSNPPPLPEVEICAQTPKISDGDLVKFFTPDNAQTLKYLLASVLEANKTGKGIYLYDDYDKLCYWFAAIQKCLPYDLVRDITFTTYGISKSSVFTLQSLKPSGVVNYRMMLQLGEYVFNLKEQIINNKVSVGKFVNGVVDAFTKSVSCAKAVVGGIEEYIVMSGNDPDFALVLSDFFSKKFASFKSAGELMDVVTKTDGKCAPDRICGVLAAFESANNYNILENDAFFRYLYQNDAGARGGIIAKYVNAIENYRENDTGIFADCYKELIGKITFPSDAITAYIKNTQGSVLNYLTSRRSNAFLNYFVVRLVAENYSGEYATVTEYYLTEQLRLKKIALLHEINGLLRQVSNARTIETIVLNELNNSNGIFDGGNYDFIFSALDEVDEDACKEALIILIKRFGKDMAFKTKAVGYMGAKHIDVNTLLVLSGNDGTVRNFIDDVCVLDFANRQHTEEDIKKYYKDIYIRGKDKNGAFIKAVEKQIDGAKSSYERYVGTALGWNDFFRNNRLLNDDGAYVDKIIYGVFGVNRCGDLMAVTKGKNKPLINKIESFAEAYKKSKGEYPPAYKVVDLGNKLRIGIKGRGENAVFEELCKMVSGNTLLADNYTNMVIANEYVDELFELYCKAIGKKPYVADGLIEKVFAPLVRISNSTKSEPRFNEELAKRLSKINLKEAEDYLMPFVNKTHTGEVGDIIDAYFAKLGGGKSKKIIKRLLDSKQVSSGGVSYLESRLKNKIWKSY